MSQQQRTNQQQQRETLHISLGPSSNAVTAHLLNLQGLAATTTSTVPIDGYYDNNYDNNNNNHDQSHPSSSYCDPTVTHTISSSSWIVPRVLMVDARPPGYGVSFDDMLNNFNPATSTSHQNIPWDGTIVSNLDNYNYNNVNDNNGDRNQRQAWRNNAASTLAYSPYSRYRFDNNDDDNSSTRRNNTTEQTSLSQRHVVWDDDDDDEEEPDDDDDDPYERSRRNYRAYNEWNTMTGEPLRQQLTDDSLFWQQQVQQQQPDQEESDVVQPPTHSTTEYDLTWRDIWMPPRSDQSILTLPYHDVSSNYQSITNANWNETYHGGSGSGGETQRWMDDVLFESIRHVLESSDYGLQGVSITTQDHGIYAGLATAILDELQEECKSAGRLIYHIDHHQQQHSNKDDNPRPNGEITAHSGQQTLSSEQEQSTSSSSSSQTSWHEANIRRVRKQINSGLALHDFVDKAHVVMPLWLDTASAAASASAATASTTMNSEPNSLFRASARLAVALETSSLPIRLRPKMTRSGSSTTTSSRPVEYAIGLQNAPFFGSGGHDVRWGTTATSLSVAEYIAMVRPSNSHPILELDVLDNDGMGNASNNVTTTTDLWSAIRQGTSIERDDRMRQAGEVGLRTRPQDMQPGLWLQDSTTSSPQGLLSSLSYSPEIVKIIGNRSAHHHYSLSAAARPILFDVTASATVRGGGSTPLSDCLSCFIQSMGIRYRPERSMVTIVDQSIGQLTFGDDGAGYGAGIYWKSLLSSQDVPVVSVVGNTTRSYASLRSTATNMKTSMGPRSRGYVNRDVLNGILPEMEDCDEALARVWDLCDAYYPPNGSGFDSDGS